MLDTVDFPVVFWGALRAGVIPVPVNTLLTPDLVGYVLEDSRAEAVVISAPLLRAVLATLRGAAVLRRIIVASPMVRRRRRSTIRGGGVRRISWRAGIRDADRSPPRR